MSVIVHRFPSVAKPNMPASKKHTTDRRRLITMAPNLREWLLPLRESYRKTPPRHSNSYHQAVTQPGEGRRTRQMAEKAASACLFAFHHLAKSQNAPLALAAIERGAFCASRAGGGVEMKSSQHGWSVLLTWSRIAVSG